jgi:hypothetical protein
MKTTTWMMVASGETFKYVSHHSIDLRGYCFKVVATGGGEIPEAGR